MMGNVGRQEAGQRSRVWPAWRPALLAVACLLSPAVFAGQVDASESAPRVPPVASSAGPASERPQVAASQPIEAKGPEGMLSGTLLMPAGEARTPVPVVLILPGSGPVDRDGNSPLGIKAGTYRLLAEGLAASGVASVRIDKRGMFASRQAFARPDDVTVSAYADDVHQWLDSARKRTGAGCIWLAGHSEGGLIALAAARGREDVCGVILLSAMGRPAGDVLREQLKANPANAPILDEADKVLRELEAGRRVPAESVAPVLQPVFRPAVQGFLISVLQIDPAREAAALGKPLMVVQGEKDLQVTMADARRLHEAVPGSTLLVLPKANHVLKDVEGDNRLDNLMAYQHRNLPLSSGLVEGVVRFIRSAGPEKAGLKKTGPDTREAAGRAEDGR